MTRVLKLLSMKRQQNVQQSNDSLPVSLKIQDKQDYYDQEIMNYVTLSVTEPTQELNYSVEIIQNETTKLNESIDTQYVLTSALYESGHRMFNPNLCPEFGSGVKIIILITSAPDHYAARSAVRLTWGHYGQRKDIELSFVVGTTLNEDIQISLEKEFDLYGDLIQGNFIDAYDNLTLKSLSMLQWVDKYCFKAHFVLKTDDDMFINIPRLLQLVHRVWDRKRSIYGRVAVGWSPNRNKDLKYFISYEQFKPHVFPTFTTGPAYLMTMDCVHELFKHSLDHKFVNLEDVLITGIVPESLHISRVGVIEFYNDKIELDTCKVRQAISIHNINYEEQFKIWNMVNEINKECSDLET